MVKTTNITNGNGDRITNRMLFDELLRVKEHLQPIPDLVEGKKDHENRIRSLEVRAYQATAVLALLLLILEYTKPLMFKALGG